MPVSEYVFSIECLSRKLVHLIALAVVSYRVPHQLDACAVTSLSLFLASFEIKSRRTAPLPPVKSLASAITLSLRKGEGGISPEMPMFQRFGRRLPL